MASSNCWRCLSRPTSRPLTSSLARLSLLPSPTAAAAAAAFSTTSVARYPAPAKKKPAAGTRTGSQKGQKTLRIKKKAQPKDKGKPPAPGERKALRKRVVLSNTNALLVEGMQDMDSEMIDGFLPQSKKPEVPEVPAEEVVEVVEQKKQDKENAVQGIEALMKAVTEATPEGAQVVEKPVERKVLVGKELIGKVVGLKGNTVDSLRSSGAFKTKQNWALFRRPGILIREDSIRMTRLLVQAQEEKTALRMVLDGARGTGKSLMLLHSMATAFVKGWIVVNIPEAQEVTNAMTAYSPIPGTEPILYSQNDYIANLLSNIAKANSDSLGSLYVKQSHDLPTPLPKNTSLIRLCELGAREPEVAWPHFKAFWSEITSEGRPPIMLCLDGLSHAMQDSLYRAPDMSFIHAHDLAIIKHFMDHLSGSATLPNGGAVIAATSKSHSPISKSTDLAVAIALEKLAGRPEGRLSTPDPYEKKYDARADKVLANISAFNLKGLTKQEARGLMEYWAQSGVLRARVDEKTVAERWAVAGMGNVGEIQRQSLWMRI